MDILNKTIELCRVYDIKPSRTKGQNFLVNGEIYDQIVAAAGLKPEDTVLEVGPGLGFLTAKLANKVKKVIAVELDDRLAMILETGLKARGIKNVEVVNENILDLATHNLQLITQKIQSKNRKAPSPKSQVPSYKIVANLPYNITSIFLRRFLEREEKPESMVLMLQKEVAQRICADPGEMSQLAVSVQFYADPEIVGLVAKENFWPAPEVDSAIIKLKVESRKSKVHPVKSPPGAGSLREFDGINEKKFFQLVKIGFSARRKMLKNNLAAGFRLDQKEAENRIKKTNLSQNIRAQELSVDDWIRLLGYFP